MVGFCFDQREARPLLTNHSSDTVTPLSHVRMEMLKAGIYSSYDCRSRTAWEAARTRINVIILFQFEISSKRSFSASRLESLLILSRHRTWLKLNLERICKAPDESLGRALNRVDSTTSTALSSPLKSDFSRRQGTATKVSQPAALT